MRLLLATRATTSAPFWLCGGIGIRSSSAVASPRASCVGGGSITAARATAIAVSIVAVVVVAVGLGRGRGRREVAFIECHPTSTAAVVSIVVVVASSKATVIFHLSHARRHERAWWDGACTDGGGQPAERYRVADEFGQRARVVTDVAVVHLVVGVVRLRRCQRAPFFALGI